MPENWFKVCNEECDLDLAFDLLEGWDHFHTDSMRGRLRSLQLRSAEAWEHFERALNRIKEYEISVRNSLRTFYLKAYCFENALIDESCGAGDRAKTALHLRELSSHDNPGSDLVVQIKSFCEVLLLLNDGQYESAQQMLTTLLSQNWNQLGDQTTAYYFAAAIAHRGLGEEPESDKQLENALLAIPALQLKFNMGLYAGTAMALLRFWGKPSEAEDWEKFLACLKIPEKTTYIFRERARRMFERSAAVKRVFIF